MLQEALNRRIIISQPITDQLAEEVISQILAINEFDEQMSIVRTYKIEPIEMFINSAGGSATAGNAIITAMEMSDTPVITYGMGIVASMALAIFISGDVRIASRLCRFMYHSVAYGTEGHIKDHADSLKEANILQDLYDNIFLERTKIPKEIMERCRNEKKDFFFSGKKAVGLGVADDILPKSERKISLIPEEEVKKIEEDVE